MGTRRTIITRKQNSCSQCWQFLRAPMRAGCPLAAGKLPLYKLSGRKANSDNPQNRLRHNENLLRIGILRFVPRLVACDIHDPAVRIDAVDVTWFSGHRFRRRKR